MRTTRTTSRRFPAPPAAAAPAEAAAAALIEIAPDDPIVVHLREARGAVELANLRLDSPALDTLRASGAALVVPLVANDELIGVLSVGPRLSGQEYSAEDRRLLETLTAHATPAVRVGQLVREQQIEIRARGQLEQELAVARLIQQSFLPERAPELAGWQLAACYRPARAVGGDFYDFIELPHGLVGLVIGDVTDKGIPAAMVMASTRSLVRASAQRLVEPSAVLAEANDNLCPNIPQNMFATCFYAVLDPANGLLRYANAGHNLPLVHSGEETIELRATGMPLGLMPAMRYEQLEATLRPEARMLIYSDGLVEAHGPEREMFEKGRVADLLATALGPQPLIDQLLLALDQFTGTDHEQEDDITLVCLQRSLVGRADVLADFRIASTPGNERAAIGRVIDAVAPLGLRARQLERLQTATAEATMNAIEHGNGNDPNLELRIVVATRDAQLVVRITDHGGGGPVPAAHHPNIAAKLAGRAPARGFGLFLIERMVDGIHHEYDPGEHTLELQMRLEGGDSA